MNEFRFARCKSCDCFIIGKSYNIVVESPTFGDVWGPYHMICAQEIMQEEADK